MLGRVVMPKERTGGTGAHLAWELADAGGVREAGGVRCSTFAHWVQQATKKARPCARRE